MTGHFITFEGGEGAGKSTQIKKLAQSLRALGYEVVETREPGGSAGAEALRHVILSGAAESFGPAMEAILFAAARNDHVNQLIKPAVKKGAIVLCDRFLDSTRVYQGIAGNLAPGFVRELERVAIDGMVPDLTIILDIDPKLGMRRATERRGSGEADRFERESLLMQEKRRAAYLQIAEEDADRCRVVDANRDPEEVFTDISKHVRRYFAAPRKLEVA